MGANGSSYPHSCSPRIGGNSQAQQTFIGTSSFSQHGYGWESKLYSLEHGHERPTDRKKKSLGLATLKRRFIKRRKSSRSADHARQMRELLSGWDVRDTNALVEEYEGTAALKELSFQASLARAEAPSLQRDLAALYQHKYCTDVDLIFQGTCFPAHRAILAARCPFFKTLLSTSPGYGAEVLMDIETAGIDVPMFSALLHYLYTGEFGVGGAEDTRLQNVDVLVQLSEEFGTPNSLEADMKGLFDYMCYYDALLSFSSDSEMIESCNERGAVAAAPTVCSAGPGTPDEDLRAHKAILSARSPFFRNLLQRRIRTGEEMTERTLQTPTRIVLDESIIPRKYVQVILHCMYTDVVELGLVLRGSPSAGSLGEVQALVSGGRGASTRTEEAMELYHIALFLEFSMLAQGCEDIVVESLSLDSLVPILKWSSQPYGSKWVHRQAMHFLCEEFSQVVTSDVLYELGKEHLLCAIQSDYLQASEQDILKYVVKWGEQQLIKRMADREPNLLSGTAHSVNKRGVKRRDLDVEELKEILSPLLPFIRTEHILPPNSDVLADALKRGLISTPPSDMLPTAEGGKANAWLRQKNAGIYVRPRLFSPYVEEAKSVLDEMMVEQTDLVRLRLVRMSNVPDTLYMVNNAVPQCCHMINHQQMASNSTTAPSVVANEIPVPQLSVVKEMIRRLQELRHTEQVQRAYALNCGEGATVSYELQLRVLREFGLADGATELLQNPYKFFPDERFGDESPILALRQMSMEPVMREFMPDIALGVSVMSLREQHMAELDREGPHGSVGPSGHHLPHGPCPSARHGHGHGHGHGPGHGHSCKRHAPEPTLEAQAEFPDLYDFSCRPATPTSAHPLPSFAGPDLYSHSCTPSSCYPPPYISESQSQGRQQGRTAPDPLRLDVLNMTSQRHDGVLASPSGAQPRMGQIPRGRSNETDLTHGLGHLRPPSGNMDNYEERHTGPREAPEEMVLAGESLGPGSLQQPHRNSVSEEIARDRRSPSKPDYPYKKSAL
ncbi:BTB/POZ domain-containing protein 7 isoform X2 [Cyclopterus lumpus]|uniref:BTB/POZ domain-containing protein 7 isoform X2 n=1 Tax=Cyclopterus lumpus TaxID=8103 RepID=UPI0014870AC2|nr:BTB/POZ domain-containing protein 7 isoform X2 [Cyclopterus lumpus]